MPSQKTESEQTHDKDYVAIAKAYAKKALDPKNRKRFGIWIRLAAKRFLDDLERAKTKGAPFYFDVWHANDVCDFAEKLPHVEGVWETPTIVLHESHVFFLVQLFGFRKPDGTRRFSKALFAVARKNAKSTLAAIVGLYCQNCEGENGPQIITGATTGQQARIVFNVAKRMVEKTSDLREAFGLVPFANAIASINNGGTYKPINAKASTQDGLNPSCVILDEIHAHKDHDLLNVLVSAAGARANVLFLFLTTEGYSSPGPWAEEREFAKKVLRGIVLADHFLAIYYAVDEKDEDLGTVADDDFDESAWPKANPLMDVNPILKDEIRKAAIEAREKPGTHGEFKIKRLNRPSSVAGGWVNLTKWRECKGLVDLELLRSVPCWGGLDLSSTNDLTSFRLVWRLEDWLYTYGWRWVPPAATRRRVARGLVPYQAWVEAGLLIECGEEVIDYAPIEAKVLEVNETFNLRLLAYDNWNAPQLTQRLKQAGVPMELFRQGPQSYHPAMQDLELHYLAGRLAHGNDPVLNWNASNLVARQDQNLNNAPDKRKSTEKIDDMAALLMATGASLTAVTEGDMDGFLKGGIKAGR
ncbi:phage terminase large subunit-like protein [Comamonas odontotermitis]|uniref:Phage terminase large subunit-like protein n=1 Tax=Comamonas odontotermitis TaxID=379895 RepID=A0ABR6RFQ9_9BURK|nr:terminase TerL endonuclease subunit [Comamonas odontotermitis]MBB6577999.1 phage terminase large subunit-like protein [Comamonas odontotermitis]